MAKGNSKRTSARRTSKAGRKSGRAIQPVASEKSLAIEVIARGCLVEGSCVLLCRNVKHGYLYLPGGHVEFGESAAAAVAREFLEECGVTVRVGELALASEGVFPTKKRLHHEVNLVFHVERAGGAKKAVPGRSGKLTPVKSREDHIAFDWVDISAVVDFDIRPTAAKAWLATRVGSQATQPEWVSEVP